MGERGSRAAAQPQTVYKSLARYYDLLYAWKDYRGEAQTVRRLIAKYKESPGNDLLEVACGTGKHCQFLKRDFNVLATDANAGMLRVARRNVAGVAFRKADMVTLDLGREFDAIVCLFSSIGYVGTPARLRRTIRNFARHLKTGGVVIIEPWFTKATYKAGRPSMTTFGDKDIKIARLSVCEVRGNVSVLDMNYLVAERDKAVKFYVDRHELGMFEPAMFLAFMREAGLRATVVKRGLMQDRGLYVGVKQ